MNKLLLVEDINYIKGGDYFIEDCDNKKIQIDGEVHLYHINEDNHKLNINVNNTSNFFFHKIDYVSSNTELNIVVESDSNVTLNWLIINRGKNKVKLNVEMRGNRSESRLKVRIINKNTQDKIDFVCNGVVLKNTYDNELLEDLKGLITKEDEIKISPNMEIYTSEVMANHLVTIGSFAPEDIFYLMSKGLSEEIAKKLLISGFTSQACDEVNQKYIKTEVINIE